MNRKEIIMKTENNVYRGFLGITQTIFLQKLPNNELSLVGYTSNPVDQSVVSKDHLDIFKVTEFFTNIFSAVNSIRNNAEGEIRVAGFLDNEYDVLYKVVTEKELGKISVRIDNYEFNLYLNSYHPYRFSLIDKKYNPTFDDVKNVLEWLKQVSDKQNNEDNKHE